MKPKKLDFPGKKIPGSQTVLAHFLFSAWLTYNLNHAALLDFPYVIGLNGSNYDYSVFFSVTNVSADSWDEI